MCDGPEICWTWFPLDFEMVFVGMTDMVQIVWVLGTSRRNSASMEASLVLDEGIVVDKVCLEMILVGAVGEMIIGR